MNNFQDSEENKEKGNMKYPNVIFSTNEELNITFLPNFLGIDNLFARLEK